MHCLVLNLIIFVVVPHINLLLNIELASKFAYSNKYYLILDIHNGASYKS